MMKKTEDRLSVKEGITEQISEIEKESLRLVEVAEETRAEVSKYYGRMLEEDFDEAEAQMKSGSLKRATSNIARALSQTYAVSDELNARCSDIRKQGKKHPPLPQTPP